MERSGLSVKNVRAVFVTHEHSDHIGGIATLTKKEKIPVYALPEVIGYLNNRSMLYGEYAEMKGSVSLCGMTVRCFPTPHDARASCGYTVDFDSGEKCAVCTDLGHVTDEVAEALLGADAVLLEANYDLDMLRNGSYPYPLQIRIMSPEGHLSNDDSGKLAAKLVENGTSRIILGHLSQENNTPETAMAAVESCLSAFKRNTDYILSAAPVETDGSFTAF